MQKYLTRWRRITRDDVCVLLPELRETGWVYDKPHRTSKLPESSKNEGTWRTMTLKEAFFEDLARHLQTWRDDLVKAIADPKSAMWAETQSAAERLHQKAFSEAELEDLRAVLDECFRGVLHSTLVTIDGGSAMSKVGTLALIDADTIEPITTGALHEEFVEFLALRDLI